MKVCLICTTGGHLVQMLMLRDVYQEYDHYFVTVKDYFSQEVLEGEKVHYITQILRNPVSFSLNVAESRQILREEKPDVILTTGAGDVLPTCYMGKMRGAKIVFLETFARVREPSLVGRFLAPIADLAIVQWKPMLEHYKDAKYSGPVYVADEFDEVPPEPKVFLVTGTHTASFHRLVKGVDDLVAESRIKGLHGAQIGHSTYEPRNYKWARFIPFNNFLDQLRQSDIILTHDGASSIGLALSLGKRVVVVPRKREFGEVEYASRQDLARYLAEEGLVVLVEDVRDIPEGLSRVREMRYSLPERVDRGPAEIIREFLSEEQSIHYRYQQQ